MSLLVSPNPIGWRSPAWPQEHVAVIDLPAEVRERYRRLARQRKWPPETESAFLRATCRIRALDEEPGPRGYYERAGEAGLAEQGTRWMWETVTTDGAVIAVKQLEVPLDGVVRRYCWWRLEDNVSGLTDQALQPEDEGLAPISRDAFYEVWDRVGAPEP
jgi:hypothetical protein